MDDYQGSTLYCNTQYNVLYLSRKVVLNMATRSANVNVRVEPDIKEQAEAILEKLGVSTSAFINMTYRQVILHNGIPFPVTVPTMPKTRDIMTDAEFNAMMQEGLRQAKVGEGVPMEDAFDTIMERLG